MAIDPKTLTIGSHVEYDGKRYEVAGILGSVVALIVERDPKNGCKTSSVPSERIMPIHITEELLSEIGFVKEVLPTFPAPTTIYVDAEYAKLRAEGEVLVVPRITIQYINVKNPFWDVSAYGVDMGDNKMAVRYLHELEQFLYLTTKTELIKE